MASRMLKPGSRLGKYEIVSHIASGGMGAVYKAIDTQLRRTVALKVLKSHRANKERDLERFDREARNSAGLTHPNIITTYDYGFDTNFNVFFMTMEFIEGNDLSRLITLKGTLSPKETRNILLQAAQALSHAFEQGIVHRDIKPSNFMMARVGGKIVIKLADFGLALGDDDDEFKVTRDGTTVGTIDYMSPEQARDSRAADTRSDIYSLGCTAYHMLTGKPPFAEGGIGERVHKHQLVPPTDVREFNPTISTELWEIVRTMLAKNPADRYQTPGELLAALKKCDPRAGVNDAQTPTLQPLQNRPTAVVNATATKTTTVAAPTVAEAPPSTESEIPKTTRKRTRSRGKKRRAPIWPFLAVGGVAAALVLVGFVSLEIWRRLTPAKEIEGPIARSENKDSSVVAPIKNPPISFPKSDNREPIKTGVGTLPVLDLRNIDWPGRTLVPFDAIGPRNRLDEIKQVQLKGTVTPALSAKSLNVVLAWESLARMKCQETSAFGGAGSTYLLAGNYGWVTAGGANRALAGELLGYFQAFHYATVLGNLIAINEGGFEIEKSSDAQIRKKDCFSILVKHVQRPAVRLYFDKQSNLLAKAEFHVRLADKNLVLQSSSSFVEVFFSNYQITDGINHWLRLEQWRDGQRYSEFNVREVQFLKYPDESQFAVSGLTESARRALIDYRKDAIKGTLAKVGPQSGSDFARLVAGLSHADAGIRWAARDGLRAFVELWRKDQATPLQASDVTALATLALAVDDDLPSFALDAMTKLGPQAASAAPYLVSLAQTCGDARFQARILNALKTTGVRSDATLSLYASLLDHADTSVKETAALTLMQLGPDRMSNERLASMMGWKNRKVTTDAEALLRQRLSTVSAKDLPALKQGLRNPVRDVQLAYLEAIASLQAAACEAAPDLVPLINSQDKGIAEQAVRTLERIGKLADFAREHPDPGVVSASLAAMRRKGVRDADAIAIYEKQLTHNDDRARDTAALALLDFAPERITTERLVEYMSRARPLDLAATLALYKAEPGHAELRTKGVPILARSLTTDLSNMKAFLSQPLKNRNAETLLDIGGAAVASEVIRTLLENNDAKAQAQNQKLEPTSLRLVGYELVKELAKSAQTKQDRALIAVLKKHEGTLANTWAPNELSLTKNLNQTPELLQLRTATAESARQAGALVKSLRSP